MRTPEPKAGQESEDLSFQMVLPAISNDGEA